MLVCSRTFWIILDDGVGDLMFETDDTIGAGDNGDDMDEPDDVGFIRGAGRGRDIDSNSTDHVDFLTQVRHMIMYA